MQETGYQSQQYAQAFTEYRIVKPWFLSPLLAITEQDLINCYPLSCITSDDIGYPNSTQLEFDFQELQECYQAKSIILNLDPLTPRHLQSTLENLCSSFLPFETHYIVDLTKQYHCSHSSWDWVHKFAESGHDVQLRLLYPHNVIEYAQSFYSLYKNLIKKRQITGLASFSEQSIIRQFQVPGLVVFEVNDKDTGIPMAIRTFYIMGENVYFHLAAQNYKCISTAPGASHALMYASIMYFKQLGLNKLVLGTGITEGLKKFKENFSTEAIQNYRAIKIFS